MACIAKNKIAMRIVHAMRPAEIKRFSFILKGFHTHSVNVCVCWCCFFFQRSHCWIGLMWLFSFCVLYISVYLDIFWKQGVTLSLILLKHNRFFLSLHSLIISLNSVCHSIEKLSACRVRWHTLQYSIHHDKLMGW